MKTVSSAANCVNVAVNSPNTNSIAGRTVTRRLALLQAVLDELPVGVYLVRGWDAELVLANCQVADIWGAVWSEGQPMADFIAKSGSRVFDLQGRELPSERLATLQALRSGQSVRGHQAVVHSADGSSLSILVDAIALDPRVVPFLSEVVRQPDAPVPVVLVVHQDVSALMEAERLKDEFVALAAHELRNPVASLLGYAQILIQATEPRPETTARSADDPDTSDSSESAGIPAIPREWQEEAATAVMEAGHRLAALTDALQQPYDSGLACIPPDGSASLQLVAIPCFPTVSPNSGSDSVCSGR